MELIDLVSTFIIFLSQTTLLRRLSFLLGYLVLTFSYALLDLFLSSDAGICSTMALPPVGNSDHVAVLVSMDFLSNSKGDAPFHHIAYDYFHADWDGLRDHLRDVPWEDIFKLTACAATSEFYGKVQSGIDIYIPHIRSYLTHSHGS